MMKPGDLARIIVPMPSLFESIGSNPDRLMKHGDVVVLLRYEPNGWQIPCWRVLYDGQVGIVAARWLQHLSRDDGRHNDTISKHADSFDATQEVKDLMEILTMALSRDSQGKVQLLRSEIEQVQRICNLLSSKLENE